MSKKGYIFVLAATLAMGVGACQPAPDQDFEAAPNQDFEAAPELGVAQAALKVGGCQFSVDRPHKSTHVPGTVNVIAWVRCINTPAESIEITLGLARNGVELTRTTRTGSGTYFEVNVAVPCVSGTYNGAAITTITFPAGTFPRVGHGSAGSGSVDISC